MHYSFNWHAIKYKKMQRNQGLTKLLYNAIKPSLYIKIYCFRGNCFSNFFIGENKKPPPKQRRFVIWESVDWLIVHSATANKEAYFNT